MAGLTGSGGDWIESRFGEAQKKAFLEQFENFYETTEPKHYPIPVRFQGQFEPKAQKAVQSVATYCFEVAQKAGFEVYHKNPEVLFYSTAEWIKTGEREPEELPAARLVESGRFPLIQVVLPPQVKTSETVIKTARLLCAKLFGEVYFDLHIPFRPPYLLLKNQIEEVAIDPILKVHVLRFLKLSSPQVDALAQAQAKKLNLRGPKSLEIGRKELFKAVLTSPEQNTTALAALEAPFSHLIESGKKDPKGFYRHLTEAIFAQIHLSQFILPHERAGFEAQKSKEVWSLFHALEERLTLIANLIEELLSLFDYLEKTPTKALDPQFLLSAKAELGERMRQLRRHRWVKLFLFEGARLGKKQQRELNQFPLWLWKAGLIQPTNLKPEKQIEQFLKQYRNSIFQKLFESTFRLKQILAKAINNQDFHYPSLPEATRLKTLATGLRIRKDGIWDMLYTARLGKDLQGVLASKIKNKAKLMEAFSQGWSYFISFALIHQYYQNLDQKKKDNKNRASEFFALIESYLSERVATEEEDRISELFLKLYQQWGFDLKQIRPLLTEPSQTLDFFILNQTELFKKQAQNQNELIDRFSARLEQWQKERYAQKITAEEKAQFTRQFTL